MVDGSINFRNLGLTYRFLVDRDLNLVVNFSVQGIGSDTFGLNGYPVRLQGVDIGFAPLKMAARLGVHPVTVAKWEANMYPVPKLAVTALRLLTVAHKTSHEED